MNLIHSVYEPAGDGPHPTLVALHGWGASALDLAGLAPHVAGGRFLVLCPQGTVRVPIAPNAYGYGWFPLTMGAPPDPAAFEAASDGLCAFLDAAARRHPIDINRVAILGFSQGGVMAYALALRQPKRFAAVAALSTWLPPALVGPGVSSLEQLPVLVQHGSRDPLIDVARGRESVEQLRRLGAAVVYREYEMEHEIGAASLRDLTSFLQERVISPLWTGE
jgi:phospholipase/carboxylesterase